MNRVMAASPVSPVSPVSTRPLLPSWWLSLADTHAKLPCALHTHVASVLVGEMPPYLKLVSSAWGNQFWGPGPFLP